MRCRVVRLVCEAVRVSVVSRPHVDFSGKLIHLLDEHVDAGSGGLQDILDAFNPNGSICFIDEKLSEIFCKDHRSVVAAWKHQPM